MNQTAVVTGATSGIGRAIALALAGAGHKVIAVGRDADALAKLQAVQNIEALQLDVTNRLAVSLALSGRDVDLLVNNAGMIAPLGNFCDADEADIDATLALNVSASIHLSRLLAPGMRTRGRGHIFFTGSTAGHAAFPNMAVYCASKAAVAGFASALRLDMAPHGVRVTEIVAGRVETGLYRDILSQDAREQMYSNHSAVQPENVADMLMAVLNMPQHVDVSRFDIVPTRQAVATGVQKKG
jgi:3-hydroxy acid dehydrogenase / malonic semialdehyde reductase